MEDKAVDFNIDKSDKKINGGAAKLRHSHSTPVKRNKETFNPLLFRNSRSNINECRDDVKEAVAIDKKEIGEESKIWTIKNIEVFPSHFEMQPTHSIVHDSSPKEVAERISDYLNDSSNSVLYDDDNAVAHVEMDDKSRLLIRLFKTATTCEENEMENSQNKDGVVIEVSRREGCSAKFHSIATKILAAAQGIDENELKLEDSFAAKPLKVPAELRKEFLKQVKITP